MYMYMYLLHNASPTAGLKQEPVKRGLILDLHVAPHAHIITTNASYHEITAWFKI